MNRLKFYILPFLSLLLCCILPSVQAAEVPQAVKYQAVIRNLEGQVIAERNDIDMKISIRLQNPTGIIVYSELHTNLESNAYGMIHLEIGRGQLLNANQAFDQIDWGAGSHYVQIEVQLGGQGFTQMGMAELLSVPYALYAANSGGAFELTGLAHNMLPKYDTVSKSLVNTSISQNQQGEILIQSPSITFSNPLQAAVGSYTFPPRAGRTGQVMVAKDNNGTIGWDNVQGGGGTGGSDVRLDSLTPTYYPYWDGIIARLADGKISQKNDFTVKVEAHLDLDSNLLVGNNLNVRQNVSLGHDINSTLIFNGTLSGANNIMKNELSEGKFWIGSPSNKADKSSYKLPLVASSNSYMFLGVNTKNDSLEWRTFKTKGNIRIDKDTLIVLPSGNLRLSMSNAELSLDSTGVSLSHIPLTQYAGVWISKADTLYTNGDLSRVHVAIGTDSPKAKLHLQDGSMLIDKGSLTATSVLSADAAPFSNQGVRMMWYGAKAAFRAGEVEQDQWNAANVGTHSTALGRNSVAGDFAFATGDSAWAQKYGFASGYKSKAGLNALAMGNMNIAKDSSIAIGIGNISESSLTIAIGRSNKVSAPNGFALGRGITIESTAEKNSFGIGLDNLIQSSSSFGIGKDIRINGVSNTNQIVIGNIITMEKATGAIAIGSGASTSSFEVKAENGLAIGQNVKVYGKNGIALGNEATLVDAVGVSSIAIGYKAKVISGPNVVAIGSSNEVDDGAGSVVSIGNKLNTNSPRSINIGTNNLIDGGSPSIAIGENIINDQDKTITIGTGLKANIGKCVVLGYAGGTKSNPTDVNEKVNDITTDPASFVIFNSNNKTPITILVTQTGDLRIPGSIYATACNTQSDIRLKENINLLNPSISILDSITPVSYNFISDEKGRLQLGFIAQDVQRYFPNLISENAGFLTLNYTGLLPVLWKYTQEQQKHIVSQQAQIDALILQIEAINASLQELKNSNK